VVPDVKKPVPVPEPVPEVQKSAPVSSMTADAALQIARTVHGWGSVDPASHFHGLSASSVDAWIGHAVAMGWVIVDDNGQLRKGPVDPNPPAEALSPREARLRWGPDWIG
jgi:hypothetical protein